VNSSMQPHAKLHKRHNTLSFHRVREAIASKKYVFTHIAGANNPSDILSKHWSYDQVWHMIQSLFYMATDTINGPSRGDLVSKSKNSHETNDDPTS